MEKILFDFIQDLLTADGIPNHTISFPCQEWDWFDFGLRSQILGETNMAEVLNQVFEDFQDYTLYHYLDSFQCSYAFFKLPSEKVRMDRQFLVIGPVLFERLQGEQFDKLFRLLKLPPQLRDPLCNHYQNIPLVPAPSHYENLMSVIASSVFEKKPFQIVFKSRGDLENLRYHYGGIARVPDHPFLNIQYIEERYQAENEIIAAVGHGNEAQAMEAVRKLVHLGIPPRLSNTLRDKKDLTITLNTLMRKSAEQAGVHPIHIDSFSNQSIQQLELLGTVEQCSTFQRKLALGYCRLVKKYSMKGYSLPVQKVVNYITTDLSVDLSLKALAGHLNVAPSYLSALFKKEMGITLTDYVSQQRIVHAQHLLLDTDFPIKSIAQQCGIADMNYFVRMFKRTVGITPKMYRDTAAASRQKEISGNVSRGLPWRMTAEL